MSKSLTIEEWTFPQLAADSCLTSTEIYPREVVELLKEGFNSPIIQAALQCDDPVKLQTKKSALKHILLNFEPFDDNPHDYVNFKTSYIQSDRFGRLYPEGCKGMTTMKRIFRYTMCQGVYDDVDIVNAHPTILGFLLNNLTVFNSNVNEGPVFPYLMKYLSNRDEIIQDVCHGMNCDRPTAKEEILKIMNGGGKLDDYKVYGEDSFLFNFWNEMQPILDFFYKLASNENNKFKHFKSNKAFNPRGSTLNHFLIFFENVCLNAICKKFTEMNFKVDILCYDGCMIRRRFHRSHFVDYCEIDDNTILEIEKYVENTVGIKIKLQVKPFEDGIDLKALSKLLGSNILYPPIDSVDDIVGFDLDANQLLRRLPPMTMFSERYNALMKIAEKSYVLGRNSGKTIVACINKEGEPWQIRSYPECKISLSHATTPVYKKVEKKGIKNKGQYEWVKDEMKMWDIIRSSFKVYNNIGFYPGEVPDDSFNCTDPIRPRIEGATLHHLCKSYDLREIPGFDSYLSDLCDLDNDTPTFENLRPFLVDYLTPIFNHIYWVFCNYNDDSYNFVIAWMSALVSNPEEKPGVGLLIRSSKEGAGKGFFWHWMCNFVVGFHNSLFTQNLGDVGIGYNHNALMEGKVLVVLDELEKREGTYSFSKTIMNVITEPFRTVNPKGVDQRRVRDYTHLVMLCNDLLPVVLSESQRRFMCLNGSNEFVGNREYFSNLGEYITPLSGALFAYYLINVNQEYKDIDIRKPIDTEWTRTLKDNSRPPLLDFLHEVATGLFTETNVAEIDNDPHNENGCPYPSSELYSDFKRWLDLSNGHWKGAQKTFSLQVSGYIESHTKQIRLGDSRKMCWTHFSKENLCKIFNLTYEPPI